MNRRSFFSITVGAFAALVGVKATPAAQWKSRLWSVPIEPQFIGFFAPQYCQDNDYIVMSRHTFAFQSRSDAYKT